MGEAVRSVAVGVALSLALGLLPPPLAAQAPPPSPAPMAGPVTAQPVSDPPPGATAAAVAVNIFRIPGKTVLCAVGTVASAGMMLLTFGTQYRAAGAVLREGCGGKWVIDASDLNRNVDAPQAVFSGEGS